MADETITMDVKQIRDEIYKGMRIFKAFENAHQVLGALEGMESLSYEIQDKLKKMKAEESEVVAARDKMLADAVAMKNDAVSEAKKMVEKAKETAADLVKKATNEALKLKNEAAAALSEMKEKHADISDAHEAVAKAVVAGKAELQDINAALSQSKAELSKFLGK